MDLLSGGNINVTGNENISIFGDGIDILPSDEIIGVHHESEDNILDDMEDLLYDVMNDEPLPSNKVSSIVWEK